MIQLTKNIELRPFDDLKYFPKNNLKL